MATSEPGAGLYRVRWTAAAQADAERLRSSRGERRDLVLALVELRARMQRDPYAGQPAAGALRGALGPIDDVWRHEFDTSGWPGAARFVLYHVPPNLAHPDLDVWVAFERVGE